MHTRRNGPRASNNVVTVSPRPVETYGQLAGGQGLPPFIAHRYSGQREMSLISA